MVMAFLFISGATMYVNAQNGGTPVVAQIPSKTLTVDQLLANGDSLIGQTVAVEGYCTHACSHGATKIFLKGEKENTMLRVQAGKLRSFDTKCVKAKVNVIGTVKEQRIGETYLQNWENRLTKQVVDVHGTNGKGCENEQKAQGEQVGVSEQARIADFRKKIAARKAACGKDYLSVYYVVAQSYTIK